MVSRKRALLALKLSMARFIVSENIREVLADFRVLSKVLARCAGRAGDDATVAISSSH
jgi:hypothetical protein